jgi:acyl-CoA thioesterase
VAAFDWGDYVPAGVVGSCEFALLMGMEITVITPDEVRVTMRPEGKTNGFGLVHGGAIFALADQAFGLAANQGASRRVAVSAAISYLAPARGILEAVAVKVAEDGQKSAWRVSVYEGDRLVALFDGTGHTVL